MTQKQLTTEKATDWSPDTGNWIVLSYLPNTANTDYYIPNTDYYIHDMASHLL